MKAVLPATIGSITLLLGLGLPVRADTLDTFNLQLAYPTEIALVDEGDKGYVFRRFPTGQRLYVYDLDRDGHSACNVGCDGARPPVIAPPDAKPLGEWSVVQRADGQKQWAFKGRPVYTLYHDAPRDPQGDGEDGVWHILPYMKPSS
jgi:predicted lipoprotein with Yx(FWY)xxD motif